MGLRIGLVLGAFWLAWPDLHRLPRLGLVRPADRPRVGDLRERHSSFPDSRVCRGDNFLFAVPQSLAIAALIRVIRTIRTRSTSEETTCLPRLRFGFVCCGQRQKLPPAAKVASAAPLAVSTERVRRRTCKCLLFKELEDRPRVDHHLIAVLACGLLSRMFVSTLSQGPERCSCPMP